jgi:peptidyl-prolyl cis-trans isomerase D
MLDLMRKNSKSWLIILLFGVIIFVFAINFGPWVGQTGSELPYAATVNGHVITYPELQMAYTQQIRTIQSSNPDFNPEGPVQEMLKKAVLERLISKSLLAQLAESEGLRVSDRELADFIRTNLFGGEKKIDRAAYQRAIYSNYHLSEAQFESQLRKDLVAEQMGKLIEGTAQSDEQRAKFFQNYVEFLKKGASIKSSALPQG